MTYCTSIPSFRSIVFVTQLTNEIEAREGNVSGAESAEESSTWTAERNGQSNIEAVLQTHTGDTLADGDANGRVVALPAGDFCSSPECLHII